MVAFAVCVAIAAALAGCSSPSASPDAAAASADLVAFASGPHTVHVMDGLGFYPQQLFIASGETVRWVFEAPGHNVTSMATCLLVPSESQVCAQDMMMTPLMPSPLFCSPPVEGDCTKNRDQLTTPTGTVYTLDTLVDSGLYEYRCLLHGERGLITVE